jgi:alpha-L-fucosidase 2
MKTTLSLLLAFTALSAVQARDLTYTQPAEKWVEALPVGNGRLGAMVFGAVAKERIALNDNTLWSGGPKDWNNPSAKNVLPLVRAAIMAGNYAEAEKLCKQMQGPYTQNYLPLGDLKLEFAGVAAPTDYKRTLDLNRALATVTFREGGAVFRREIFSSHPDQVIVVRLTCDQPGRISLRAGLSSLVRSATAAVGTDTLALRGKAPSHSDPSYVKTAPVPIIYGEGPDAEGMTFDVRVRAIALGGKVECDGQALVVTGADAVTLLVGSGTSFNGYDKSPAREGRDASAGVAAVLAAAVGQSHADLQKRHEADYRKLYDRVQLDLGPSSMAERPTVERLLAFAEGGSDPELPALLFDFGRYLLIASSRRGGQAANLQGLWNESMRPPWSSNYTININTQMNYWPAEVANLAECHEPLLTFIGELAVNGRKTAAVNYGARGWVSHHNSDLWRQTSPVGNFGAGDPVWANYAMSAPWLCQHLWEHYAFGGDRKFLRETAWPVMKGAAEFCLDWLVDDGTGRLVTMPSTSPEIGFVTPDGTKGVVTKGATMDLQIIWDLFTNCLEATQVLGIEPEFAAKLAAARAKLLPLKVGSRGQLQEWADDFMEKDVHHRHVSHLFGLHPGRQITRATPEFYAAARKTLELRGDDGTGWSLGWKINFWARFRDGDHAYTMIRYLLRPVGVKIPGINPTGAGGGVYPNLFDAHPPFQIDGNFAFTAGICEMLVQSHAGEVELLPALPQVWPNGRVRGLRARGGIDVTELTWRTGALSRVVLRATLDGPCTVRLGERTVRLTLKAGETVGLDGKLERIVGFDG